MPNFTDAIFEDAIFEDARKGILLGSRLENSLRLDPSLLNDKYDRKTGWALLATAVVAGFPDQVEQLLERGADPTRRCKNEETPLLLATWKTQSERPLIVQKLLTKVPKKLIDDTCDIADNNTPLMCAIEKLDGDSVRLLAGAGANLDIKNDIGFNAVQVAENTGKNFIVKALDPKKEKSLIAELASDVVNILRHIVWWVDDKSNGIMGKMFGFTGERDEGTEKVIDQLWTYNV